MSLLLATGECPDLFCPIDPFDGLAQGLTRTIPVEMLHEHAPQYTKLLNDFYPIGWLLGQSPDDPTEYVALHMIGENADTLLTFATFRSDWAENVDGAAGPMSILFWTRTSPSTSSRGC